MTPAARPVVLDVDTGIDDGCALLLAAGDPEFDLRAVTCVAGNTTVDRAVANTRLVLAAAGRADVPVARGAAAPLSGEVLTVPVRHGVDGLGDLDHAALRLPEPTTPADPRPAVDLLRETLRTAAAVGEQVDVLALGPRTNVAELLHRHPEVAPAVRAVTVVGGRGADPDRDTRDLNAAADPDAAEDLVSRCRMLSIALRAWGLERFPDVEISRADAADLVRGRTPAARLAGALVTAQCDRLGTDPATLGDAGAVCELLAPDASGGEWARLWLATVTAQPNSLTSR